MTCNLLNFSDIRYNFQLSGSWSIRLRGRFPVTNKAFVFFLRIYVHILLPLAHLSISARSSDNVWFSDEMVFQFEL